MRAVAPSVYLLTVNIFDKSELFDKMLVVAQLTLQRL